MPEGFRAYDHLDFLLADQGMRKVHVAAHTEFVGRIDANAPVTLDDLQRLQNFEEAALAPESPSASFLEHLHERLRRAIKDRHFDQEIIQVNAAKHDAGISGSRYQTDVPVNAGVQPHSFSGSGLRDGCLEHL